jgi:predicted nuclease of predicted toxin-antitoxin system
LKLLLDEMLSPAIARALRARGHDVDSIKEHPAWAGLPDVEVVALARVEHRAIVTCNLRDFRLLHAELITPGSPGHSGIVFVPVTFRLTRAAVGSVVTALEEKLAAYPGENDLANGETWL